MERLRQQFASDPNIFPEFAKPLKKAGAANEPKKSLEYRDAPSGISTASTNSSVTSRTTTASPPPKIMGRARARGVVIISSDEESEGEEENLPPPRHQNPTPQTKALSTKATPIHIPSNRDLPQSTRTKEAPGSQAKPIDIDALPSSVKNKYPTLVGNNGKGKGKDTISHGGWERQNPWDRGTNVTDRSGASTISTFSSASQADYDDDDESKDDDAEGSETVNIKDVQADPYDVIAPAEAEKALRELMGGPVNENADVDINMEDAVVKGFKEGITLLPHQVLGRAWMREREDLSLKRHGGILADDMGLGKTIQTLTRIVEGRARKADAAEGWAAATLVVCPLALLAQWEAEIHKMVEGFVVITHHGTSRTADPSIFRRAHVVVTTYDVVKSEYEAYEAGIADEIVGKGKVAAKKNTKKKSSSRLSDNDGSDDTKVGSSLPAKKGKKVVRKAALFKTKWWRIVLDEAHNIKNEKTKGAIACCALEGKYRWCLTGTPMQNNVTELFSLIKFLRIKPLNNWNNFNDMIAKPVKSGKGASRAMKRLQVVLKQVMLRRRKDQWLNGKPLVDLPPRTVNVVSCTFDRAEKAFYETLESKMASSLQDLRSSNSNANYMSILHLLLRLRQACNHPSLASKDSKVDMEAIDPKSVKKGGEVDDGDADALAAVFGQLGVSKKCQVCLTDLTPSNIAKEEEWSQYCVDCAALAEPSSLSAKSSSAKIRTMMKLLEEIEDRSQGEEKTIIFSQFTSMLDLIEPFLREKGIKYVRYDGKMRTDLREYALEKIKTSTTTKIILISFKAGSTGLNLTACNNVILVDLWWNPALEDQAFDRAHRFGQTREVHIYKLKIDDTVEDRILILQEKKRELAKAALSGDKVNMKLGMDELLALFRPGGRDDDEEDFEDEY